MFLTLLEVILKALDNPKSKCYEYNEYTYDPYALDYCTAHYIYMTYQMIFKRGF